MNQQFATDKLPLASLADYQQLRQTRHGLAPTYTLSLESIAAMPPLPAFDWATVGGTAPVIVPSPGYQSSEALPGADIVIICWTSAEWAALHHVFCDSSTAMSYNGIADTSLWNGDWLVYARDFSLVLNDLTGNSPSAKLKAWGRFRLVSVSGKKVLLFKSDMHIHTDGKGMPVIQMIDQVIADVRPGFILSTGTAGGVRTGDALGTANVTNAARFKLSGQFIGEDFNNTTFNNPWTVSDAALARINALLLTTPVTTDRLQELLDALNNPKGKPATNYTLADVLNQDTEPGQIPPKINSLFGVPVLTTNGYDVANMSGNYGQYAAMEMDDAVIAMEADANHIPFGVIRNISDPVENTALPSQTAQSWGGTVYNTYGFYSSFNSSLAAWACIS